MRLALDRACASRPEISDRADEAAIASTIAAAIATTIPIRTLDLIVIHTPKTVSLEKPVARWAAWKQVSREEIEPIAEPPKQFTHPLPKTSAGRKRFAVGTCISSAGCAMTAFADGDLLLGASGEEESRKAARAY